MIENEKLHCSAARESQHLPLIFIHTIPELFARLEMRDKLAIKTHRLAGLGIAPHARCAVVQGKAAETTDLDTVAGGQALGHLLKHSLDGQLHIL